MPQVIPILAGAIGLDVETQGGLATACWWLAVLVLPLLVMGGLAWTVFLWLLQLHALEMGGVRLP